jgi:hypothetical protein
MDAPEGIIISLEFLSGEDKNKYPATKLMIVNKQDKNKNAIINLDLEKIILLYNISN